MKKHFALMMLTTFVSCSSFNDFLYKSKCTSGNWEALARTDASSTNPRNEFSSWVERCAPYAVKPQKDAYDKGFQLGLLEACSKVGLTKGEEGVLGNPPDYCQESKLKSVYLSANKQGLAAYCVKSRAYEAGLKGVVFNSQNCPRSAELNEHHQRGTRVLGLRTEIAKLESEIADFEKKVFDPATPEELKKGYLSILVSKKADLKAKEKELILLESK